MELDIRDVTEAWELLQDRPKTADTSSTGKKMLQLQPDSGKMGLISVKLWQVGLGGKLGKLENVFCHDVFQWKLGMNELESRFYPRFNLYLQFPRGLSSPTAS